MENFTPEKTQKELSPETVEKIMGKIIDIDTKGTAYSSLGGFYTLKESYKKEEFEKWEKLKEKIQKILRDGLLGLDKSDKMEINEWSGNKTIKEKYTERITEGKVSNQLVYANIVGRSPVSDETEFSTEIGNSYWVGHRNFSAIIVFDKDFFEETEPTRNNTERSILNNKWKFNADDPDMINFYEEIKSVIPNIKIGDERAKEIGGRIGFDKDGMPKPYQEYGFVFFPRVPKRTFKGLVVKIPKDEQYDQRIQEVTDAVVQSNLQIPIYDTDGNVLWPKKMSFEEVKKIRHSELNSESTATDVDTGSSPA
jgi:hypothetical protein